jgi:epoxyqueuosine reductase
MTVVLEQLRNEGYEVTAFFYNPNIHPWKERKRRLDALIPYVESKDVPLVIDEEYPLEKNLSMLLGAENRCFACFEDRLSATAKKAKELGIPDFSTTLSVSPYQNQEFIMQAGSAAGKVNGVNFVYRDFRELYRESIDLSRKAEMYRQPYCGCVFSERDRYLKMGPEKGAGANI